jgi:hypothetical protein
LGQTPFLPSLNLATELSFHERRIRYDLTPDSTVSPEVSDAIALGEADLRTILAGGRFSHPARIPAFARWVSLPHERLPNSIATALPHLSTPLSIAFGPLNVDEIIEVKTALARFSSPSIESWEWHLAMEHACTLLHAYRSSLQEEGIPPSSVGVAALGAAYSQQIGMLKCLLLDG